MWSGIFYLKKVLNIFCHVAIMSVLHPMKDNHIRKDVDLHNEVIEKLKLLAEKKKWTLKQFMQETLIRESNKVK